MAFKIVLDIEGWVSEETLHHRMRLQSSALEQARRRLGQEVDVFHTARLQETGAGRDPNAASVELFRDGTRIARYVMSPTGDVVAEIEPSPEAVEPRPLVSGGRSRPEATPEFDEDLARRLNDAATEISTGRGYMDTPARRRVAGVMMEAADRIAPVPGNEQP